MNTDTTVVSLFLLGVAAILYAPSLYVRARNWWRASNADLDALLVEDLPPLPRREPRLHADWPHIANAVAQARADIALESGDFAEWTKEMSS